MFRRALFLGHPVMLEIIPSPASKQRRFRIPSDSNALVRSVRENVARECGAPVKRVRLMSNGKELAKVWRCRLMTLSNPR
jgi:hypothetical protein